MVNWGAFLGEASLAFIRRMKSRAGIAQVYTDALVGENELNIEAGKIDGGQGWCIDALKLATCSCGPTVLKEATFNLLVC
jgi:hypothetical protein